MEVKKNTWTYINWVTEDTEHKWIDDKGYEHIWICDRDTEYTYMKKGTVNENILEKEEQKYVIMWNLCESEKGHQ